MSATENKIGCGIRFAEGVIPVGLACGEIDDFGMQQLCHTCNARLYATTLGYRKQRPPVPKHPTYRRNTMKRKIEVRTPSISITATITTTNTLTRGEVESVRDDLADRLLEAAACVRYLGVPRNRVRVK